MFEEVRMWLFFSKLSSTWDLIKDTGRLVQLEATDLSAYQSCCLQTAAGEAFHEAEQSDVLMYFLGGANVLK